VVVLVLCVLVCLCYKDVLVGGMGVWGVFCVVCVGALFDLRCVSVVVGYGLMVFGCWICVVVCVLVVLLVVFSGVVLGWWVGGCFMICVSYCLGVVWWVGICLLCIMFFSLLGFVGCVCFCVCVLLLILSVLC